MEGGDGDGDLEDVVFEGLERLFRREVYHVTLTK